MKIQIEIGNDGELMFMHVQALPRVGDYISLQTDNFGGDSLEVKQVVIFATESEIGDIAAHIKL